MERMKKMVLIGISVLAAAGLFLMSCSQQQSGTDAPSQGSEAPGNSTQGSSAQGSNTQGSNTPGNNVPGSRTPAGGGPGSEAYAVKSVLRELFSVDPEKGIGVYGRYTELTAEGDVPETFSKVLAEVNARAKENVETRAKRFLAENSFTSAKADPDGKDRFRYRNISYITNVTRADQFLFSILETEMESGIGDKEGERLDVSKNCVFHAAVYETQSGEALTLADFMKDPGSFPEQLEKAIANKYAHAGLPADGLSAEAFAAGGLSKEVQSAGGPSAEAFAAGGPSKEAQSAGGGTAVPAWTADYLGLRFYFDGAVVPEDKMMEAGVYNRKAVHVSIPYTALDGAFAKAAEETPESFVAQLEKNTEYALPHDKRVIRIEKADNSGYPQYRIVIRDGKDQKAWWLEYADDDSDYYVFRAQGGYYFYRLEDEQDRGYVYNFASPDGGYDRFENQNAQCFDSFLHELYLAVPYDPDCAHMRERTRKFMDPQNGLTTTFAPNGHYAFLPERGRGRTWLHFALIDDALALDSHNVGCRLLHAISGKALDAEGNEGDEITVKAGEVLRFLRVDGEGELYFYMSPQYNMYKSGSRDYHYDCELADGRQVRLVTQYENSFFVDGMYMDRIGEPVTIGAAQYEAGMGEIPEHYVEIAGKEYKLRQDLSLRTESGEEIDFGGDVWWIVENYVGTYVAAEENAGSATSETARYDTSGFSGRFGIGTSGPSGSHYISSWAGGAGTPAGTRLVISENGDASFEYDGRVFKGKLPEKRFYRQDVYIYMEAEYEMRTFRIIVEDDLPPHDPSFRRIRFYSEGEPATNEPSRVPPIEVELVREDN